MESINKNSFGFESTGELQALTKVSLSLSIYIYIYTHMYLCTVYANTAVYISLLTAKFVWLR